MRRVRADNLEVDSQEIFTETAAKYGNRWAFFHRADLHTGLRSLVQAPIELASEVTKVDPHTATITLIDGRVIRKDLLVIADGAHVSQLYGVDPILTNSAKTSQPSPAKKLQWSKRQCRCIAFSSRSKRLWRMKKREASTQTNLLDSSRSTGPKLGARDYCSTRTPAEGELADNYPTSTNLVGANLCTALCSTLPDQMSRTSKVRRPIDAPPC